MGGSNFTIINIRTNILGNVQYLMLNLTAPLWSLFKKALFGVKPKETRLEDWVVR